MYHTDEDTIEPLSQATVVQKHMTLVLLKAIDIVVGAEQRHASLLQEPEALAQEHCNGCSANDQEDGLAVQQDLVVVRKLLDQLQHL